MEKTIIGYKGFNNNMTCRGKQYAFNSEYEEEDAVICKKGLHFCENPLDVFEYYPPANSRYALVEGSGKIDRQKGDNSKIACTKLRIGEEINLIDFVNAGVKFILNQATSGENNTGYGSAATNTGNYSAATNTGDRSAATNTGYGSAATNTGNYSAATNTGNYSAATNTGNYSAATNTGYCSAATNTGYCSVATNTGDRSAATNTGNCSAATNTGDCSAATNTGYRSAATNTGNYSAATNTGDCSNAVVEGNNSVAVAIGYGSKAKGALGCWIVLAEWADGQIIDVQCAKVNNVQIKPGVFYSLKNGQFVEITEEDDGCT